ncbi:hypothetical protein ACIQPQ_35850 [Streptomyces sp. NPDC091281]|uniref:hypothetical protein n=1 Tax=Streptomyces sp. NPDC091281 TaxID=3365985 RepID=UPI0038006792
MICARCDRPIVGEPVIFSPEIGSGVAPEVLLCPEYCRPAGQRQPKQRPAALSTDSPRPRPRR